MHRLTKGAMFFGESSMHGGEKKHLTDSVVKRRKIEYDEQRIYIGDEIDRWTEVKEELNLPEHSDVARVLLDRYCDTVPVESERFLTRAPFVFSMPATEALSLTEISEMSFSRYKRKHALKIQLVDFDRFPSELCAYKYCRARVLEHVKLLSKDSTQLSHLENCMKNQILWICPSNEDQSTIAKDVLKEDVVLKDFVENQHMTDESSGKLNTNYSLVMIYVKINEDYTVDDESKVFLMHLKNTFTKSDFTNIVCFVNLNSVQTAEFEMARLNIKTLLELSSNPQVLPTPWNFTAMRDILHCKTTQIIHHLSDVERHNREDIITLVELERILGVPKKSNIVTPKLKEVFSSLRNKGYAGHVYLDGQLTVYVREGTESGTMGELRIASQEQFDNVDVCILSKGNGIKMCTSIAADERAENHLGKRGTLGAIAKMSPSNKTVAVSVGHFSSKGQMVKVRGTDIGKCIWPIRADDSCNLNDVSIIDLLESLQVSFLHQNMQLQYRNLSVSREVPILFQEVFKGRGDVGITTGTITAVDACLPSKDGEVNAYLVEGELDTTFAREGDSGAVVKLIHEENGKLVGCALVFGLSLELPNIRRDTCITIPLRIATERFEIKKECSLSFDVV